MAITQYSVAVQEDEQGRQFFIHFVCGRPSYNPNDIKFRYCAHCHKFPEDQERIDQLKKMKKN